VTAMKKDAEDVLHCSFCNKSQNDVKKLIAGPTVFICDECVDVCNEIICDDITAEGSSVKETLPKPVEIKEFLEQYVIGQEVCKRKLAVAVYNRFLITLSKPTKAPPQTNKMLVVSICTNS